MVGTVAQVLVALALILGSNGLHRLLYRIRYGHDTSTGSSASRNTAGQEDADSPSP